MKVLKYFLLLATTLSILLMFVLGVFVYIINKPTTAQGENKSTTIEEGMGLQEIANTLKQENLISSEYLFVVYTVLGNKYNKLKAGEYELSSSMSIARIANILVGGEISNIKTITFPEGFTKEQIAQLLLEKRVISNKQEFLALVSISTVEASELYKHVFLKEVKADSLEGFLFPDTYEFKIGDDKQKVIDKFLKNFEKRTKTAFSQNKTNLNNYQILILASLLEKEVQTEEDMKLVSGVLYNRLRIGMALQVDATLAYIMGKKTNELTNTDKQINSLFNTYKYKGFPPAPIANPGLKAINAAINPTVSDYLYYLSSKDGTTIFAKTLEEHNANRAKYLK